MSEWPLQKTSRRTLALPQEHLMKTQSQDSSCGGYFLGEHVLKVSRKLLWGCGIGMRNYGIMAFRDRRNPHYHKHWSPVDRRSSKTESIAWGRMWIGRQPMSLQKSRHWATQFCVLGKMARSFDWFLNDISSIGDVICSRRFCNFSSGTSATFILRTDVKEMYAWGELPYLEVWPWCHGLDGGDPFCFTAPHSRVSPTHKQGFD